jgi:hypothetical protein
VGKIWLGNRRRGKPEVKMGRGENEGISKMEEKEGRQGRERGIMKEGQERGGETRENWEQMK